MTFVCRETTDLHVARYQTPSELLIAEQQHTFICRKIILDVKGAGWGGGMVILET
jgi:hypothetical protein